MGHDWIIDVLADLKRFANTHDLPMLEAQLENTTLVASAEIGRMVEDTCHLTQGDGPGNRQFSPSIGAGRRA
ncbi:hypothetical protein CLV80_10239 [Yoonia maritima]|uniref:Uncharacterized protein n=1 Tax=Yoonia maritima TaxID=1435347 RepID=A0A2T0W2L7_9RHOB|nr:hypothetical protein [Yoonia maritima]PRY79396.1 hypothetical protein CLV80_10239 [Yoonia maritima]